MAIEHGGFGMYFRAMLLFDFAMELRWFLAVDPDRHYSCISSIFDNVGLG